jgi:hypothetical protein
MITITKTKTKYLFIGENYLENDAHKVEKYPFVYTKNGIKVDISTLCIKKLLMIHISRTPKIGESEAVLEKEYSTFSYNFSETELEIKAQTENPEVGQWIIRLDYN